MDLGSGYTYTRDKSRHARGRLLDTRNHGQLACLKVTSSTNTKTAQLMDKHSPCPGSTYETECFMAGLSTAHHQDSKMYKSTSRGRPSSEAYRVVSPSIYSQSSKRQSELSLEILDYYILTPPPISPLFSDWYTDPEEDVVTNIDVQHSASNRFHRVIEADNPGLLPPPLNPDLKAVPKKHTPYALHKSLPPLPRESGEDPPNRRQTYSLFPVLETVNESGMKFNAECRNNLNNLISPRTNMFTSGFQEHQESGGVQRIDYAMLPSRPQTTRPLQIASSDDARERYEQGSTSTPALYTNSTHSEPHIRPFGTDDEYSANRWSDDTTLNQRSTVTTVRGLHFSIASMLDMSCNGEKLISFFDDDDDDKDAKLQSLAKRKFAWAKGNGSKSDHVTSTVTIHRNSVSSGHDMAKSADSPRMPHKSSFTHTLRRALLCGPPADAR